jgi:predicted DNA-binding transcriptional regulator AlpA
MTDKILVTAVEGAGMLSMGRSTFWRAVGAGMLPQPVRIGGLTRWRVADLMRAVDPASLPVSPSTAGAQRE